MEAIVCYCLIVGPCYHGERDVRIAAEYEGVEAAYGAQPEQKYLDLFFCRHILEVAFSIVTMAIIVYFVRTPESNLKGRRRFGRQWSELGSSRRAHPISNAEVGSIIVRYIVHTSNWHRWNDQDLVVKESLS